MSKLKNKKKRFVGVISYINYIPSTLDQNHITYDNLSSLKDSYVVTTIDTCEEHAALVLRSMFFMRGYSSKGTVSRYKVFEY